LWLRGKARLALEDIEQAKDTLLKARAVAEGKGERTILWQILATLAGLEDKYGEEAEAEKLKYQARNVIYYIADHASDAEDLRATFLAQPAVKQVLSEP
jgi:hypothetical protein